MICEMLQLSSQVQLQMLQGGEKIPENTTWVIASNAGYLATRLHKYLANSKDGNTNLKEAKFVTFQSLVTNTYTDLSVSNQASCSMDTF